MGSRPMRRRSRPLILVCGLASLAGLTLLAGCGVDGEVEGQPVQLVANRQPPATPTGLSLTAVGDDSVLATWDAPAAGTPQVISYQVILDYEQEADVAARITSHTFVGVASGERHTATLTAIGSTSDSQTATTWIILPPDQLPTSTPQPAVSTPALTVTAPSP